MCKNVKRDLYSAKSNYYCKKIAECQNDQRAVYKILNTLTGSSDVSPLPDHSSSEELANKFVKFFDGKVKRIITSLPSIMNESSIDSPVTSVISLGSFHTVSEDTVLKTVMASATKSCSCDPLPTWLLKSCSGAIIPFITRIVNASVTECKFPDLFKSALITPLLKKPSLDHQELSNYRPISNLTFISKVLERIILSQINAHLDQHELFEPYQSAYRSNHSTETALLRVQNDVLNAIDDGNMVILLMIDLSAAFDLVNHNILLSRLKSRFGIENAALTWIESYLRGRSQQCIIEGTASSPVEISRGVPQGSVLGPVLFSLFTTPLGDIAIKHDMERHFYADDSQFYLRFKLNSLDHSLSKISDCVSDIRKWMAVNQLKLNDAKTELIVFGSKRNLDQLPKLSLSIGDCQIIPSGVVRNLGSFFDSTMSMATHIGHLCQSSFYTFRTISRIRRYITDDAAKSLLQGLLISRLDYCNALLYGLPTRYIRRLQLLQNNAARVILRAKRRDHVTPLLRQLHWLPVERRIEFKLSCLVYKCLNGSGPKYLTDLLNLKTTSAHFLRSTDSLQLNVPKSRTVTYGDRSFSVAGPTIWNSIPIAIRRAGSITSFKRGLKFHLFNAHF